MTLPTITYSVGDQDDCGDASGYNELEEGITATLTVDNGTVFNIAATVAVGNKSVYYEKNLTNISSSIYGKFMVRYKTSSDDIKAKIVITWAEGGTQTVLAETSNTDWTVATVDLTTALTIDTIRLYATQATGNVYFDFWTIYTGTQTFHNYDILDINPRIKKPILPIPGSDTDVSQHLGRANTIITIEGPMRSGKDWGSDYATTSENFGEFLMNLLAERHFQWFTSSRFNFKVMPVPEGFHFRESKDSDYQLHYVLTLEEYDVGDASIFTGSAWYGK